MVIVSQNNEGESFDTLEDQIRECFGRVVYAHKTQEKAADETLSRFSKLKSGQIFLSAVSSGGFIAVLFGKPDDNHFSAIVVALISAGLFGLNTFMQGNDLGQLSEKHKTTAAALWDVRESYLSLLTDIASKSVSVKDAKEKRDELQARLAKIYETAPRAAGSAYDEASKGLKDREEYTFKAEEIDKFLPDALHKANKTDRKE
jgi:hypothetical protein